MRITPNQILSPLLAAAMALSTSPAGAADSADCQSPKFSDVGWTDITATTAAASVVLRGTGHAPETTVLSRGF